MDKLNNSIFTPIGGANQDDSLITPSPDAGGKSLFEMGDYRYALNVRLGSSRSDNFGDIENIADTVNLPLYLGLDGSTTPPSGTNKVVGKYEDTEFQRIYRAVSNSNGNHAIVYYDLSTNTTYEILKWNGLNFSGFVKMAKLDNWLTLTDRDNAPRLINTDTIGALFLSLGTGFREFHISLHKWAPTPPPIPRVYFDGVTNNYEKLKNKVYHFAYRYIYFDNLKSRWSPISKGAVTTSCGYYYTGGSPSFIDKQITSIEVDMPGCIYDDPTSVSPYNYFGHSDIKFTSAVQYIELAFRDGELELWKQWKIVPTSSFNRYQYFNGEANLTPLDEEDFNQIFDTVPFKAGTVEAVDNRFVFADVLDEEPAVTGLTVTDVAVAVGGDWTDSYPTSFGTLAPGPKDDLLRRNSLSNFTFKDRATYKVGVQWIRNNGWRSAIYTVDDLIYKSDDTTYGSSLALNFKLNITPPSWAVAYQVFRTNALDVDAFIYGIVNKFTPLIDDVSTITDQISVPQDVKDRINQHFENERIVDGNDVFKQIEIEINKAIADDKKKNKNRNNLLKANEKFAQPSYLLTGGINGFVNKQITKKLGRNSIAPKLLPELRKTKTILLLDNASRIYIDINNWWYGSKKGVDQENKLNNIYYNFRRGDRLRFVGSDIAAPTLESELKEYDVAIIEFTGKGIIIEKPEGLKYIQASGAPTGFYHYDIEIYTPKTPSLEDHLFYEVGEWYPVTYPGTPSRALSKSDFVYVNNAAVSSTVLGPFNIFHKLPLYYADAYRFVKRIYRDITVESPAATQSGTQASMNPDPDKTFDYWDHNNGRVSVAYRNIPIATFKGNMARFGGRIIEQSFVNGLNNFKDEDQFVYPSEYGRIRNLVNTANAQVESVGSILLAIGEREAWSIYVNRTTLEDLSGSTQVLISDEVLGSYNTLLGSHGTLNPESVCRYRGNVYWWDAINGSWVRYGRDGLTPISDYKKRNWFKELGALLLPKYLTSEKPVVLSEFDPFNMELVTYINHSSLPATFRGYSDYKGDTFSEKDKRWKMCHSYNPEMFAKLNNDLYSFKAGLMYKHEAGSDYGHFYGVRVDSKIEPVFNVDPMNVKHWRNLIYLATDRWSVERILSEYRGNKSLIESRIALSSFDPREDTFWAAIKGNINTPNVTNPLIEGKDVRCKAIQVLFKLDPDVQHLSLLHYAVAEFTDSIKNP